MKNNHNATERLKQIKNQLNLSPSAMSLQAPKDMAKERSSASFDIQELACIYAGGKDKYTRRQNALKFIEKDPYLVVQAPKNILELSKDEIRDFTMGQLHRLARLAQEMTDKEKLRDIAEAAILYAESLAFKFGVHDSLFRNVINMLGSKEQQTEWIPLVDSSRILGSFSMTELGHSSALREIETVATFDIATDEFVIDSPSVTSTKWWIGLVGHTATHTVALAQTVIHGKNVGLNWFIVQLRDAVTGEAMPNIQVGDVGHKVGHQGVDNGWIQFRKVRVPRKNMLSKWATINRQGEFTPAPNPAVMYATLIPERIQLASTCILLASQALTIASRYGVVRRQGNKNQQIMDYQSHYVKLLPAVAFMHMTQGSIETVNQQFSVLTAGGEMDPLIYLNHMGDMHCISASMKGLIGAYCAEILETCRRSCGGHAYSTYNAIGTLIGDFGVMTTGGGDNVVLLQQAARFLLHLFQQKMEYDDYPELKYKSSTNYIQYAKDLLSKQTWSVTSVSDCIKDLGLIEDAIFTVLVKRLHSIQKAINEGSSHEDLLLESVRVAELHCASFIFSDNARKHASIAESQNGTSTARILRQMTTLWGLHVLKTYGDQGFIEGYFTPQHIKGIEKEYLALCKSMRYEIIGLTDAFGYPDFVLKAPIARYDGNIYEPYFETVLQAPNSTGVPSYHEKLIKPLTESYSKK